MKQVNFYEFEDILNLFGSKTNIAESLGIDRSQITRWKNQIPGAKQLDLLRLFNKYPGLEKEYAKILRARKKRERENGLPD